MNSDEIKQISSKEAFEEIKSNLGALLIDVRSELEWKKIGIPDLGDLNENLVLLELQSVPSMEYNQNFLLELEEVVNDKNLNNVMFICKAGVRSQAAAVQSMGVLLNKNKSIKICNISDGFEGKGFSIFGDKASGWKNSGLPWKLIN
ncbi:MAG: rhodanese-like domain-containing protein [Pseudomonadota bacterium]|nr:rhodanese-like domain-containing protein [Pseudomonadota bacterium]